MSLPKRKDRAPKRAVPQFEPPTEVCEPEGGKVMYRSRHHAKQGAKWLAFRDRTQQKDKSQAYQCPTHSEHWHLAGPRDAGTVAPHNMSRERRRKSRSTPKRKNRGPVDRQKFDAAQWDEASMLMWARGRGKCECGCGTFLRESAERHHRKAKSQGGDDRLSNLVLLLPEHHARAHANPEQSRRAGLIVSATADPARAPIVRDDGRRWYLLDDGTMRPET